MDITTVTTASSATSAASATTASASTPNDCPGIAADLQPSVLIVENDSLTSDIIDYVVHQAVPACQTQLAVSLRDATAILSSQQFDLVIADLGLPDSDGVDTAASIRAACSTCAAQIMLYSAALNDPHVMAEAHDAGFEHCIPKGANSRSAVRACLGELLAH